MSKQQVEAQKKSAPTARNPIFRLNKGVILTTRKIEDCSRVENYMHFATLVHKINLYLLEYKNLSEVETILDIVYSEKLVNNIIDFVTNTDYFCNFGLRLLEHFCILDKARKFIEEGDIFYIMLGLLRTNDNETTVSALSFLSLLLTTKNTKPILSKVKILPLLVKLLKTKDIEYVFFIIDIISKCDTKSLISQGTIDVLKEIESSEDFIMLPDILRKCSLIRKELETYQTLTNNEETKQ